MTTPAFNRRAGPTAQAMNTAYKRSMAGEKEGTFPCPKCGSTVRFTALIPHESSGQCNAACGVKWNP